MVAWFKLNEIKCMIESGEFNKGEQWFRLGVAFCKGGWGNVGAKHFTKI